MATAGSGAGLKGGRQPDAGAGSCPWPQQQHGGLWQAAAARFAAFGDDMLAQQPACKELWFWQVQSVLTAGANTAGGGGPSGGDAHGFAHRLVSRQPVNRPLGYADHNSHMTADASIAAAGVR